MVEISRSFENVKWWRWSLKWTWVTQSVIIHPLNPNFAKVMQLVSHRGRVQTQLLFCCLNLSALTYIFQSPEKKQRTTPRRAKILATPWDVETYIISIWLVFFFYNDKTSAYSVLLGFTLPQIFQMIPNTIIACIAGGFYLLLGINPGILLASRFCLI